MPGGGSEVERCVSEHIEDDESQRCGAARSRRRLRDGLQVQSRLVFRHRGCGDNTLDKVGGVILPEDGLRKMAAATISCAVARAESLLDR
jgi:hypothetical protein